MKRTFAAALGLALLGGALLSPALSGAQSASRPSTPLSVPLPAGRIDVLSYNVRGLPWPFASDRPEALQAIGDRLAALRAQGTAPQVVVLQEAFTRDAEAIARRSGYRYAAYGPGSDDPRPHGDAPAAASAASGLLSTPWLSSGLIILSDYPLTDIRRAPFPEGACAGYDCLANKGVLSARIHVPGVAAPVEIVTTHLNSGRPSGEPEPVSRPAYAAQLRALADFVAAPGGPAPIRILAGDFNVGHSPQRLALLADAIHSVRARIATAQGRPKYAQGCRLSPHACRAALALAANVPLTDANDWQFYAAAEGARAVPIRRQSLFGPDRQGAQLSDHEGLSVTYRLEDAPGTPTPHGA